MPDLNDIYLMLTEIKDIRAFGMKPEIDSLPQVIQEGERILDLMAGNIGNVVWLTVCTDRRVLFLDKGPGPLQSDEIALDDIFDLELVPGQGYTALLIKAVDRDVSIRTMSRKAVRGFIEVLNKARGESSRG